MSDLESSDIKKSSSGKLLKGLVAAIVVAAFLGGYSLGLIENSDSISNEELAEMILEINEDSPAKAQQAARPDAPIFVSLDNDPLKGNPNASLTIVEFSDFQCPFCSRFYQETLPLIEQNYVNTGKVNLVYRDMPLAIHPNAIPAHIAAECAYVQNAFWEYHDILFERQSEWNKLDSIDLEEKLAAYAQELNLDSSFNTCVKSASIAQEVQMDYSQAVGYGVTGTPTFFVGNPSDGFVKLSGAQPYSAFQAIIDAKLG